MGKNLWYSLPGSAHISSLYPNLSKWIHISRNLCDAKWQKGEGVKHKKPVPKVDPIILKDEVIGDWFKSIGLWDDPTKNLPTFASYWSSTQEEEGDGSKGPYKYPRASKVY